MKSCVILFFRIYHRKVGSQGDLNMFSNSLILLDKVFKSANTFGRNKEEINTVLFT